MGKIISSEKQKNVSIRRIPTCLEISSLEIAFSVFFDGFVVEPGAVAGFPFQAADHAELGCTATGELLALLIANMKREWDGGKYQVM